MKSFYDKLPKPFFCLAPMEDVTNVVFRQIVLKAARPDVFYTEFMNVSSFTHEKGRDSAARRLQFLPNEHPLVAQIWGTDIKKFQQTAQELVRFGFDGIDINMGCPDKAVVKTGGGSGLIHSYELAAKIIEAVKIGVADVVPVSVKTRLGTTSLDNWQSWISHLLKQNLAALTIHLRTRKEMSKVPAHYELIDEVIQLRDQISPQTKIIINGDIKNYQQGTELIKKHPDIDGIMIGRGVFENPFCFKKTTKANQSERAEGNDVMADQLIGLLKYHLKMFDRYSPHANFEPLKKFFKIYIRDFDGAKELREQLMQTKTTNEIRDILRLWQKS